MINIVMDSQVLTALQTCPRYYQERFLNNLVPEGGKSNALECGSLAHNILEWYFKAIIDGKSVEDAKDIGFAAGLEYIYGYKESNLYIKDETEEGVRNTPEESIKAGNRSIIGWKWVIETMQQYFDFYKSDNFIPLNVEFVDGKVIYEDSEMKVLWKAKFDLIAEFNDGIMPTDHKTSSQRNMVNSMNNQFMGQCILTNTRRMMVNKIGWQSTLEPHEKFERAIVGYSLDRLQEWQQEIVPHYARMLHAYNEAENFPMQLTGCESKFGLCQYNRDLCACDPSIRDTNRKLFYVIGKKWDVNND